MRVRMWLLLVLVLIASGVTVSAWPDAPNDVVISQLYGGGGNIGARYRNDYVELFNRTAAPVELRGWKLQYGSAAGTTWRSSSLTGTVGAHRAFLVRLASGGEHGSVLPQAQATSALNLARASGKVRLLHATGATVDLVGYGRANLAEGRSAPSPANATQALARRGMGCIDTGDNAADVTVITARPRTASSPQVICEPQSCAATARSA